MIIYDDDNDRCAISSTRTNVGNGCFLDGRWFDMTLFARYNKYFSQMISPVNKVLTDLSNADYHTVVDMFEYAHRMIDDEDGWYNDKRIYTSISKKIDSVFKQISLSSRFSYYISNDLSSNIFNAKRFNPEFGSIEFHDLMTLSMSMKLMSPIFGKMFYRHKFKYVQLTIRDMLRPTYSDSIFAIERTVDNLLLEYFTDDNRQTYLETFDRDLLLTSLLTDLFVYWDVNNKRCTNLTRSIREFVIPIVEAHLLYSRIKSWRR